VYLLSDRLFNRFTKLYAKTKDDNKVHKYILKEFQVNIKNHAQNVPICFAEDTTHTFEDLVKMLAAQKLPQQVYASCFIEVARALWKQPQLFYHGLPVADCQANMRACEKLIRRCIKDALAMQSLNVISSIAPVSPAEVIDEDYEEIEAENIVLVGSDNDTEVAEELNKEEEEEDAGEDAAEEVAAEEVDEEEVAEEEIAEEVAAEEVAEEDAAEEVAEEDAAEEEVAAEEESKEFSGELITEEISEEVAAEEVDEVVESASEGGISQIEHEVLEETSDDHSEEEDFVEVIKEDAAILPAKEENVLSLRPKPINDAWDTTKSIDIDRDADILQKYVQVSINDHDLASSDEENTNPPAGADNSNEFF
jgi:flagellar biosynthesis GTPase FlhF